jgi:diguanylate cyclase (GGDEF)-like protein
MTTKKHTPDNKGKTTEQVSRPTNMHGAHVDRQSTSVDYHTKMFFKEKISDLEESLRKKDETIRELMETIALAALNSHRSDVHTGQISKERDTLKKENEHLKRFAYLDESTGLEKVAVFNNIGFPRAFGTAMRHDLNLALILIDLNNLKVTNDTDSYEAGNRLLAKTANVIKGTIRNEDSRYKFEAGYRWGGDEFVVLANIPAGPSDEVYAGAKTLIRRLEDAMVANGVDCSIGACIMASKEAFPAHEEKGIRIVYTEKPNVKHEINLSGGDIGMIRDTMFKSAEKEMKKDKAHKKGKHISTLKRE